MIVLLQVNWETVGKTWGPMGVGFVLFIILVWQGAKMARQMLQDTISDARRERDLSRQLLEKQATDFLGHIKQENEEFRNSLKGVVEAFERAGRKR